MMISALFTEKTAPGRIPGEKCSTIDVVDAADETDAQRRPQRKKRVPGIQNFVAGWKQKTEWVCRRRIFGV